MPVADINQPSFLLNVTMISQSRSPQPSESDTSGSRAQKEPKLDYRRIKSFQVLQLFVAFQRIAVHKEICSICGPLKLHGCLGWLRKKKKKRRKKSAKTPYVVKDPQAESSLPGPWSWHIKGKLSVILHSPSLHLMYGESESHTGELSQMTQIEMGQVQS